MELRVLYFAQLREQAGCETESLSTEVGSLSELYRELAQRHGFRFATEQLRVAQNGEFADWEAAPLAGAEIVFIPPVSGG